jgi:hypothetical protein
MDSAPPTVPPTAPPPKRQPGEPYCSNCGYSLVGATESGRCPECGEPLVETLTREPRPPLVRSRRYKSEATMFGLPIISIAFGPDPETGELRGKARGIIAMGDTAIGGIAVGGAALGIVSFGGAAGGLFSAGGAAFGLFAAIGGGAIGAGMSTGGAGVGALAAGGAAIGVLASGGGAVGIYAQGGGAKGKYVITPARSDPEAVAMFDDFSWYFGQGGMGRASLQPPIITATTILLAGILIALFALLGHRQFHQRRRDTMPGVGGRNP